MVNLPKQILTNLVDGLSPSSRHSLLTWLAGLRPGLRNTFLYRVALRASANYQGERVFSTNLGISRAYKCKIPYDLAPGAVWGRPEYDYGEWHSMLLAGHLTSQCDAFVDIGSYIGYYVFYVWHHVQGSKSIYFFEPVEEYFDYIERNIADSRLAGVSGFNKAMGDRDGIATFFRNNSYSTCGSLTDRYAARDEIDRIEVPVVTFTSFIAQTDHQRVCVKVDVEGAEQLFLDGARESLDRIEYLIAEVLDAQSEFLSSAKSLGFHVYHILPEGLRWRPDGTDVYIQNQWNWLFCRHHPDQLGAVISPTGLRVIE